MLRSENPVQLAEVSFTATGTADSRFPSNGRRKRFDLRRTTHWKARDYETPIEVFVGRSLRCGSGGRELRRLHSQRRCGKRERGAGRARQRYLPVGHLRRRSLLDGRLAHERRDHGGGGPGYGAVGRPEGGCGSAATCGG